MCRLEGKHSKHAATVVYTGHESLEALSSFDTWSKKPLRSQLKGSLLSDNEYRKKASKTALIDESLKSDFVSANGIKEECVFLQWNHMTCTDVNNVDIMHGTTSTSSHFVGGMCGTKRFSDKDEKKLFVVPQKHRKDLNNFLKETQVTCELKTGNQVISLTSTSTSKEHQEFCLYFLTVLLYEYGHCFKSHFINILVEYSNILREIMTPIVHISKLKSLYLRIANFLKRCDSELPDSMNTVYLHCLIHYPYQMLMWGPCYYFNCFSYERTIG